MNAHILSLFQVMEGDQTLIHNSSEDLATFLLLPVQHSPPLEQFFSQILRESEKKHQEEQHISEICLEQGTFPWRSSCCLGIFM